MPRDYDCVDRLVEKSRDQAGRHKADDGPDEETKSRAVVPPEQGRENRQKCSGRAQYRHSSVQRPDALLLQCDVDTGSQSGRIEDQPYSEHGTH